MKVSFFGLLLIAFASPLLAEDLDSIDYFEKEVRPLLVKRCFSCHSGTKSSGGLSLQTASGWKKGGESGPALVPGKPEDSLLIEAINYRGIEMPPADKGKLSDAEIQILTKWVQMGAPDPRVGEQVGGMSLEEARSFWAFQPLPKPDPNLPLSIDRWIDQEIAKRRLVPSPQADKRTLIRRASYDLIGLPPTIEEVEAFLKDDSPDAFDQLIERLLASPQYGVRWGRHWLDVVRYADTAGENTDRPLPHAWRYRNWVVDSINRDLPFDQFVRMQIAGDLVQPEPEGIIATGYLAIARRFGHDIDKDIHLTHEDVIDNLGKNFLGLTLGCARCHDHKYDPVSAEDYYALSGIFQSTKFAFPGCEPKGQPRDLVPLLAKSELDALNAKYHGELAEYERQLQEIAQAAKRLKGLSTEHRRLLNEAKVGEGQTIPLPETGLERIPIKKGEVLQLTLLPNENHGADTTRVELEITRIGTEPRVWKTSDLIPIFTDSGPAISQNGATWCLLDVTEGPLFLHEKKLNINGKESLQAWAIGDTPSSLVNTSPDPVDVWTRIPGKSFFVHPGQNRNVAVAWICPEDGEYQVRGLVADGHPAGLDGVSYRLEHLASSELGSQLIELSKVQHPTPPIPPAIPVAYAVVEGEFKNARMHVRGDPEKLGDEVPRRWLSIFGSSPLGSNTGSGRVELADRIVENPLLARVMVNRIWQWHFGQGLVTTPNDFGSRGERPSHPELLNELAARFRDEGFRLKPLHRLIMKSAAYQRASTVGTESLEHDVENRGLSFFSRRRLSAEELRDSLLMLSGQLDLSLVEGHPFPPESSWNFTQHNPFSALYDTNRRSLFLMVQRQRRHPFLALFDGADPNSSTPRRQSTTVPTQALYFLNDPFFHSQTELFARSIENQPEPIRLVFRRLLQREPTSRELEQGSKFLQEYPGELHEKWAALARVLLASNEFLYLD